MTRSPPQNSSMDTDELRKRAEQRLATKKHSGKVEDAQKLLHELRVHHIELEMQNEALCTARLETETALENYTTLFDFAPIPYLILKPDGAISHANHAAATLLKNPRANLNGNRLGAFISAECIAVFNGFLKKIFADGGRQICELTLQIEGQSACVLIHAVAEPVGETCLSALVDITERKQAEKIIQNHANFDPLTGLPNRSLFQQEIKKTGRNGLMLALLFMDLDRFKEINDTLGHDVGDLLLIEAAKRLSDCVRGADTVARLGGDEFTVILNELNDLSDVERVARNILRRMTEPFQLRKESCYISISIGIALLPNDANTSINLLKKADQAMYAAKDRGGNCYNYFTQAMQEAAEIKFWLANELQGALVNNQLWLAYQPIVELATGVIRKAEALLRWQHPQRGLIDPAEFIPIAEDTRLINSIGDWVFRQAARQVGLWRTAYRDDFQISVNKSPVQFMNNGAQPGHTEWFVHLRQLGLPGDSIAVEITENLLLDADNIVSGQLIALRDAGIPVSLDDFGTGYSALSYLKKFHIDYLKIDQSFIQNLVHSTDDKALCEAMIVMSHKLGIKVIAEGVETEEQRDLLIAAGCDYAQGFLWSRPVKAAQFEELLK